MLEWEWYSDTNTTRLFLHLLLTANREDKKWQGINVKRGQLITSAGNLSKITRLSLQSIRTCITKLKSTGELTSKTTSHCTILTICNYEYYQDSEIIINKQTNKQTNKRPTNHQQAINKPSTTTKEVKKIRNKEGKEIKNKEHFFLSFVSPVFLPVWEKWIAYRKLIKKPYHTENGMKKKYNELINICGDDVAKALLIVEQSIDHEWTGFFPLKTNSKAIKGALPGEDSVDKMMRETMEILNRKSKTTTDGT